MLRTRRLRNVLRATATAAERPSRGELASGFAGPVDVVAQVARRLEDVTSELDLGGRRGAATTADSALGIVCDD